MKSIIVSKNEMLGIKRWLEKGNEYACPMRLANPGLFKPALLPSELPGLGTFCHPDMCMLIFPKLDSHVCPCERFGKDYVKKRVSMLLAEGRLIFKKGRK